MNLNIPLLQQQSQNQAQRPVDSIEKRLISEFSNSIKEDSKVIKERVDELVSLGISPQIASKAYLAFKFSSVDSGMELLSKTFDDKWNHKFIESDDEKCFVCAESKEKHKNEEIKLSRRLSERFRQMHRRKETIISPEELSSSEQDQCEICCEDLNSNDNFSLSCKHEFCYECIQEYLTERIKVAEVLNINCPMKDCDELFSEEVVLDLVDLELARKFIRFQKREQERQNPGYIDCPALDCEGFGNTSAKKEGLKNVECNFGHSICCECRRMYHGETVCEEEKDILESMTKGAQLRKCPGCKVWTEKSRGCNHITCNLCKHEWCWICLGQYTSDHFNAPGSPCYGKLFEGEEVENNFLDDNESILMAIAIPYMLSVTISKNLVRESFNSFRIHTAILVQMLVACLLIIVFPFFNTLILSLGYCLINRLKNVRYDSTRNLFMGSILMGGAVLYLPTIALNLTVMAVGVASWLISLVIELYSRLL